MNKKQKGNRAENQARAILESKGWVVERARTSIKMIGPGKFISQDYDFFNLFDLIAKNEKKLTLWIQVKSDPSDVSKAKTKIKEFHDKYCNHTETSEVWLRVKRKGYIIYKLWVNEWIKRYINLKGEEVERFKIKEGKDVK